jgi:hypothetical protein
MRERAGATQFGRLPIKIKAVDADSRSVARSCCWQYVCPLFVRSAQKAAYMFYLTCSRRIRRATTCFGSDSGSGSGSSSSSSSSSPVIRRRRGGQLRIKAFCSIGLFADTFLSWPRRFKADRVECRQTFEAISTPHVNDGPHATASAQNGGRAEGEGEGEGEGIPSRIERSRDAWCWTTAHSAA